jgi:hypothetical protein
VFFSRPELDICKDWGIGAVTYLSQRKPTPAKGTVDLSCVLFRLMDQLHSMIVRYRPEWVTIYVGLNKQMGHIKDPWGSHRLDCVRHG